MIERKSIIDGVESIVKYSDCEKYRYVLTRIWKSKGGRVLFIGLNPSTADELKNDPTVTRMVNFSKNWGFGSLTVCNLFAFRATVPKVMKAENDPIGEENDFLILKELESADLVVAVWGNHGTFLNRSSQFMTHLKGFSHFGFTKLGEPRHILYLKGDSILLEGKLER